MYLSAFLTIGCGKLEETENRFVKHSLTRLETSLDILSPGFRILYSLLAVNFSYTETLVAV
jgi:hypothetical protein